MAIRTDEDKVKDVLMSDYGPKSDGNLPPLDPFIRIANLMTTRAYTCSVTNGVALSTDELVEIETWLAAHFYVCSDQVAQSRSEAGASMSFGGTLGEGLMSSKYGQTALIIDASGCLKKLGKRAVGMWLGTANRAGVSWTDRNG